MITQTLVLAFFVSLSYPYVASALMLFEFVNVGDSLTLTCLGPVIGWTYHNESLTQVIVSRDSATNTFKCVGMLSSNIGCRSGVNIWSQDGKSIQFFSITLKDDGIYQCNKNNSESSSSSYNVSVSDPSRDEYVFPTDSWYFLTEPTATPHAASGLNSTGNIVALAIGVSICGVIIIIMVILLFVFRPWNKKPRNRGVHPDESLSQRRVPTFPHERVDTISLRLLWGIGNETMGAFPPPYEEPPPYRPSSSAEALTVTGEEHTVNQDFPYDEPPPPYEAVLSHTTHTHDDDPTSHEETSSNLCRISE